MGEPVAGKFLLEILTKGMYSNPMHVYREYIQNSTDAIDQAIASGILSADEAAIHINIDCGKQTITIRDNGCGISADLAREILLSIGDSLKNGVDERGFRGIGRLAGLAYAKEVIFRFLHRQYKPNGEGGLFTLEHPKYDLRNEEIWYQAMWYLDENFDFSI